MTASAPSATKSRGKAQGTDRDFSFTVSTWNRASSRNRSAWRRRGGDNASIVHTVLDRSLFRAGETVSMKHFLRRHVSQGIALPEGVEGSYVLTILHNGSGQKFEQDVKFGADGVAEQRWAIPQDAKLGTYSFSIRRAGASDTQQSGEFRVEEFRLPTMRASIHGTSSVLVRPREATLDLHVAYLSGGGAANLPVKVRTVVEPLIAQHAGYDDFRFGGEPVKEGLQVSEGSWWDVDFEGSSPSESARATIHPLTLDEQGAARITVADLPELETASTLTAELEYADPNGELLTSTGSVRLVPSEVTVGVRPDGWVSSSELMRFRVVVLDLAGQTVAGKPVAVSLYRSMSYSYRKRSSVASTPTRARKRIRNSARRARARRTLRVS
ncbi:MAG: MG2 domain-containing protein [Gammaproteobacteria bacterium]